MDAVPADRVVNTCWRATRDASLMLDRLFPATPEAYRAFLSQLTAEQRAADADLVWRHLPRGAQRLPPDVSFSYIDYLLRQGRVDAAANAWRDLKQTNPALMSYATAANLVENGGFELDLLNGGFDWRCSSRADASLSALSTQAHSGARSLRITFAADQLTEAPIRQLVPVKPGKSYKFSAYAKAEWLRTVSGVRLRVFDELNEIEYALTDEVSGSTDWTKLETTFTTAPVTSLLTITVVRSPGNSSIHGTLWLDDVSLTEVP
jgi:hypothetical protein